MNLGTIEILAGDFIPGKNHQFLNRAFVLQRPGKLLRETIPVTDVQSMDIANEENTKTLAGSIGMGVAGAALLGPVGLLAGVLAGGNKKTVTFICTFKDGRRFMGTTSTKVYAQIQAACFS